MLLFSYPSNNKQSKQNYFPRRTLECTTSLVEPETFTKKETRRQQACSNLIATLLLLTSILVFIFSIIMVIRSLWISLLALTALCLCPVLANAFSSTRQLTMSGGGRGKLKHQRLFSSSTDNLVQEKPEEPHMKSKEKVDKKNTKIDAPLQIESTNNDKKRHFLKSMDGIVFSAYLCNVVALSLPVILLPMAASEHISTSAGVASTVAAVSSIATLGGAVGKFANGFICKELGSYTCSKYYLAGLSICSLLFSISPNASTLGLSFAGMEFAASSKYLSTCHAFCDD
jgi:hypothetical protein